MSTKPLESLKKQFGLVETLSKRCQRYLGILDRGIITKNEMVQLRSILSNHGLRGKITDHEQETLAAAFVHGDYTKTKLRLTPEHTEQGLNFFKALIYTPTGRVRAKWETYLDTIESNSQANDIKAVIDNFSHFEFAGFDGVDYNSYRNAYNYMPIWRTVAKDGKAFEYTQCHQAQAEGRYGKRG